VFQETAFLRFTGTVEHIGRGRMAVPLVEGVFADAAGRVVARAWAELVPERLSRGDRAHFSLVVPSSTRAVGLTVRVRQAVPSRTSRLGDNGRAAE
jgi:hypothetical protein